MEISTIILILILACVPVFVFLYNLVAAITRNVEQSVRRAMEHQPPKDVTAVGNIFLASLALTVLLALILLFLMLI